jgi:hypothetical protein
VGFEDEDHLNKQINQMNEAMNTGKYAGAVMPKRMESIELLDPEAIGRPLFACRGNHPDFVLIEVIEITIRLLPPEGRSECISRIHC